MTPLLTTQISDMDEARMEFINKLNTHIMKLREELRINEIILHSIVRSVSTQTEAMADLDAHLNAERTGSSHHRPLVMPAAELDKLQRALLDGPQNVDQSGPYGPRGPGSLRSPQEPHQ